MSSEPKNLPSEWMEDFLMTEILLMLMAGPGNLSMLELLSSWLGVRDCTFEKLPFTHRFSVSDPNRRILF